MFARGERVGALELAAGTGEVAGGGILAGWARFGGWGEAGRAHGGGNGGRRAGVCEGSRRGDLADMGRSVLRPYMIEAAVRYSQCWGNEIRVVVCLITLLFSTECYL